MELDVARSIEEQLSAFIDGELPEEELALLVRRLERDESHRATLARYTAIGGLMRNDPVSTGLAQFRQGVMRAIDNDGAAAEVIEPKAAARQSGFRGAIAAGVAVVVATGIYFGNFGGETSQPVPVAMQTPLNLNEGQADAALTSQQPVVARSVATPSRAKQTATARPANVNRARMTSYLISHGEYARQFQGAMVDSRMSVQQARFEE